MFGHEARVDISKDNGQFKVHLRFPCRSNVR
jgi:hypothetical protein